MGSLAEYYKTTLHLEAVSIVSNRSLIKEDFFIKYGRHIDILAISCDSFDEKTNIDIGRGAGDQVDILYRIADWCKKYGIKFKINTVVCRPNVHEDMNKQIQILNPFRWKVFQVLMVAGENNSEQILRDVRKFMITDNEFELFCAQHQGQKAFVPESNKLMTKSYLILDEYMRFLDRDGREPSPSILEVGVEKALSQVYWDEESFKKRGGIFDWTKTDEGGTVGECGTASTPEDIDW